jgi:hypothetical protein
MWQATRKCGGVVRVGERAGSAWEGKEKSFSGRSQPMDRKQWEEEAQSAPSSLKDILQERKLGDYKVSARGNWEAEM